MGKYSEQLNKKFKNKNMEKEHQKTHEKYFNRAYRPDTEVKLTGQHFMFLRKLIQEVRADRVIRVIDEVGNTLGQGLSPKDFDIENLFAYVEQLHRKNIDDGITVSVDVLRKELEEQAKEEKKADVEKPQSDTSVEEKAVVEKKVTIKEKVE